MVTLYIFLFLFGLIGTFITIKAVIIVSKEKHLFDDPSEDRKIHKTRIPNLGGVAMYCTFIFSVSVFLPTGLLTYYNSFVASSMILFAIGLKDDLIGVSPEKKFVAQIFAALILSYIGDVRFTNLYGLFSFSVLSFPLSIILTILFYIFIYNAINLIDGIDGLAGMLGVIGSITYCILFWLVGSPGDFILAFGFLSILLGFLYFNITPAKVFMGDTGSLFTGFMLALFSVRFLELHHSLKTPIFISSPAIVFSIILIPVFDTSRVFLLRIISGKSPFVADKNHLHHRLLRMGFTHLQSTLIMSSTSIVFILAASLLQFIGNSQLIVFLILLAILLNLFFWSLSRRVEIRDNKVIGMTPVDSSFKKSDINN